MVNFKTLVERVKNPTTNETTASLRKENNPDGYFLGEKLAVELDRLSGNRKTHYLVSNLTFMFNCMKQNLGLTKSPQHVVDAGEKFTWLTFKVGRVTKTFKVPHISDMERFIDDYANGVIKVTQTLEELYDEATS